MKAEYVQLNGQYVSKIMIIAIDPGTDKSAAVQWDGTRILDAVMLPNFELCQWTGKKMEEHGGEEYRLVIEMVASYGMPVGKEVFETCVWIGRFYEYWRMSGANSAMLIYRRDVKLHLCQSARAKDANIRQALIDRFGKPGTKKERGVTYGIKSHLWAAFALAVYAYDTTESPLNTPKSSPEAKPEHM